MLLLLLLALSAASLCLAQQWAAADELPASVAEPYVFRALKALRQRPEGYEPTPLCKEKVGLGYLQYIRSSRTSFCTPDGSKEVGPWDRGSRQGRGGSDEEGVDEGELPPTQSSAHCYLGPFSRVGEAAQSSISLCRSRNMVLNSCAFYGRKRSGILDKKFPMPLHGAVQMACNLRKYSEIYQKEELLESVHTEVWWHNATRDDKAVKQACDPSSDSVEETPTLFVMRDRHANYAHDMEVLSMAFSMLAALNPTDVKTRGIQVIIVDQAPPTGFMESYARLSHPHKLRFLAQDPYPEGTCFRSAYHVYSFAAGIGYNTNSSSVECQSPVLMGFSNWMRGLYQESDEQSMQRLHHVSTSGIVMKNVVWLSRRNLEAVRVFLRATPGWKAMRLLANEDEVMIAMHKAIAEWNSQNCLVKRFNKQVETEYAWGVKDIQQAGRFSGLAGGPSNASKSGDNDDDEENGGAREAEAEVGPPPQRPPPRPRAPRAPAYKLRSNVLQLDKLWESDTDCRKGNILFKFVDGDFNDVPYHQQLPQIFRTGVLVGVHGAGLTHGYLLPPGQSAVLQLLGNYFANVPPINVFRNMAKNVGNFYEDVMYQGVQADVDALTAALKRAMDFVANQTMAQQMKRAGSLRVVLDDQLHFSTISPKQCEAINPADANALGEAQRRRRARRHTKEQR